MPVPGKKSAITRISAKERIYEAVRGWIIDGTLKPNEKLFDSEIAEYFEVSRTPVREALQMLEAQKLIEVRPGKATTVSGINEADLRKWYLPMAYIQALAAELACEEITSFGITELEIINRRFTRALASGEISEVLKEDEAFHRAILEASGNQYIKEFSDMLLSHIQRVEYEYFSLSDKGNESVKDHEKIISSIREKNKEDASEHMKSNWLKTMFACENKINEKKSQE